MLGIIGFLVIVVVVVLLLLLLFFFYCSCHHNIVTKECIACFDRFDVEQSCEKP